METFFLLLLGFAVGLSGAMIPGPLLVYTISKTLKDGPLTGFYVILGHAAVELALILLVFLGSSAYFTNPSFHTLVSVAGGLFMLFFSYSLYHADVSITTPTKQAGYGAVVGGVIFTAFNPGFPLWWATAGARLLLEGYNRMGYAGAFLVVFGHWIADLSYYLIVSTTVHKGREKIISKYAKNVKAALAVFMLLLGVYFVYSAF